MARYTSATRRTHWDWPAGSQCSAARLADEFLRGHARLSEVGYGQDWLYVGWYQHLLHVTHPDLLPVAFADSLEADT